MEHTHFPRLSEKEFLIIGLLVANGRRMYGLELVDKSNGNLKRGTIYVTLGRLETKGYVSSQREERKPGIATPRRFYKITGDGANVYRKNKGVLTQSRNRNKKLDYGLGIVRPEFG